MKLFKIAKDTECQVRHVEKSFDWKNWKTLHENIFAFEQIIVLRNKDYYVFRSFNTEWEIKVLYSDVEILA